MKAIVERTAEKYYVLKIPGRDEIGGATKTILQNYAKKLGYSVEYIDKRKKSLRAECFNPNPSLQSGYEEFHGHAPRTKRAWNFHCPKGFVILGKAVAIEYRTDKLNGGGDGKSAIYRHEFDDKAVSRNGSTLLLMDERQSKQLYIVGEKLIVTDRGIEH